MRDRHLNFHEARCQPKTVCVPLVTLTGDSYRTRQRRELLIKQNRAERAWQPSRWAERASRQRATAAAFSTD